MINELYRAFKYDLRLIKSNDYYNIMESETVKLHDAYEAQGDLESQRDTLGLIKRLEAVVKLKDLAGQFKASEHRVIEHTRMMVLTNLSKEDKDFFNSLLNQLFNKGKLIAKLAREAYPDTTGNLAPHHGYVLGLEDKLEKIKTKAARAKAFKAKQEARRLAKVA